MKIHLYFYFQFKQNEKNSFPCFTMMLRGNKASSFGLIAPLQRLIDTLCHSFHQITQTLYFQKLFPAFFIYMEASEPK